MFPVSRRIHDSIDMPVVESGKGVTSVVPSSITVLDANFEILDFGPVLVPCSRMKLKRPPVPRRTTPNNQTVL